MKKKLIVTSLLIITLSSSFTCTKGTHYFYIENKSSIPVYYEVSFAYPDTSLSTVNRPPGGNYIEVNSKETDKGSSYFAFNDTLQYFIFSADTIEQKTWEEVKANGSYLKRYTFSMQDLEMLNWTITYP